MRKYKILLTFLVVLELIILSTYLIPNSENNELTGNLILNNPIEKINQEVLNQIDEAPEETISILVKKEDYKEFSEGVVGAISKPFIEIKKHSDESGIEENIESLGGRIGIKSFDYISVDIPANNIKELANVNSIEHIYPDRVYYEVLDNSPSMINAPIFWESGYTGKNVKIAILDTGINSSHIMLEGKVIVEKVFTGEESANDVRGHGTHVAGIAAGKNVNGYSGVAPDALLINAKVLRDEDGSGRTSEIISGIEWAVDPDNDPGTDDGADIISMSLGGTYSTPDNPYTEAINYAISKGVVVVVSSGNCGSGCPDAGCGSFRGVTMPGNIKDVITVGAVDNNKEVACFSSGEDISGVGIKPDIVAPGKDITSSVPGGYALKSGTSMASPHVSGAIALLKEKYPNYSPLQIKQALELTSTDLGEIGKDVLYGSGLLNLEQLLHFDINSVIEYDVHFKENIIKNEPFKINVTIIDDIVIDSISVKITYPDSSQISISLTENSVKSYIGEFIETSIEGKYDFEVLVKYNNGYISSQKNYFNVVSQNLDLGFIKQVLHENELDRGKPFNLSVTFENSANSTLDVFVEIQILYSGNIMGIFTTDHISVNPRDISIMERDIEDSYYCNGDFDSTNICSNSVDENWDTYTSAANSDWGGKENGCFKTNYIYENIICLKTPILF